MKACCTFSSASDVCRNRRRVMTKLRAGLLLAGALLMVQSGIAQTPSDVAPKVKKDVTPVAPVMAPLCVGTAFNTTLVDPIDTRKAKTGDVVTVTTAEDVTYERSVVFPKGTKIVGHIIRATSGGRGRTGSALLLQFDKAVLGDGEEVIVNAGIQALAVTSVNPQPSGNESIQDTDKVPGDAVMPVEEGATESAPQVVSTIYDASPRQLRDPLSPLPQGEIGPDGLFTPDSKGAFGRPEMKIYTPTSEGSHGTVLLSAKKNMHLEPGTRLLLVVQPPSSQGTDKAEIDLDGIDQP